MGYTGIIFLLYYIELIWDKEDDSEERESMIYLDYCYWGYNCNDNNYFNVMNGRS